MNGWISVKERLPEQEKIYLLSCLLDDGRRVHKIGRFVFGRNHEKRRRFSKPRKLPDKWDIGNFPKRSVTHWMELPVHPKEQTQERLSKEKK